MYVLIAILMFGVLIFVHELGHFLTAKALDVQVNEFAICMGPAIFQKKKGETTYSLRCIPIGGFCAMEGEDEESVNPRAFTSKVWWKRIIILAAGSFMNFLAGFLVLVILFSAVAGVTTPVITDFMEDCPLEGTYALQAGDELWKIDDRRVYTYNDVALLLSRNDTGVYDLTVKRSGQKVELPHFEMKKTKYVVDGIAQEMYGLYFGVEEATPGVVLKSAWYTGLDFARMVWMSLGDLISGRVALREVSGPVGIVSTVAQVGNEAETTADGLLDVFYLLAFIAVNLAVMNLLPVPALDGGRIAVLLISTLFTAVTKKKIPGKYEGYLHGGVMVLLLLFIAAVTLKDIWTLIF